MRLWSAPVPSSMSLPTPSNLSSQCSKPGAASNWPLRSSPVSGFHATTALARAPPADVPTRMMLASADCACRSEEHTSELQSLMRNSYAVVCLKKKTHKHQAPILTTDEYIILISTQMQHFS